MDLFEEWLSKKESKWIERALTADSYKKAYEKKNHKPFAGKTNFELATYGDSIIKYCYCEILLDKTQSLTKEKEKYESDKFLVEQVAQKYDLIKDIQIDRDDDNIPRDYKYSETDNTNNNPHKFIATAVEAMIGAIYKETKDMEAIIELLDSWREITEYAKVNKD